MEATVGRSPYHNLSGRYHHLRSEVSALVVKTGKSQLEWSQLIKLSFDMIDELRSSNHPVKDLLIQNLQRDIEFYYEQLDLPPERMRVRTALVDTLPVLN